MLNYQRVTICISDDLCMSTSFSFRFQAQTNSGGIPASDASCVTVAAEITQPQKVAQPFVGRSTTGMIRLRRDGMDGSQLGFYCIAIYIYYAYVHMHILYVYILYIYINIYIYILILYIYINMLYIYILICYIYIYINMLYIYILICYIYIYIY